MILFEIDIVGITVDELESDAPRTIDMYSVANRIVADDLVKIKARQVQIFRFRCRIECIQSLLNSPMQSDVDFRSGATP